MNIKIINKANHKMSFTELCNEVQEKVFSRLKEENIDVEHIGDVLREEADDYINRMCMVDVVRNINDFGVIDALHIYDEGYGLSALEGMDKNLRIKCLLQCALKDYLEYDMDERYDEWCEENREGEGQCETTN
jgi:hypothetical protein